MSLCTLSDELNNSIANVDIVYSTRIQEERFTSKAEADLYRGKFRLNQAIYTQHCEPNTVIMHPLPRDSRSDANELDCDLDDNPNLAIFRQTDNGLLIRMALFALVLDVVDKVDEFSHEVQLVQLATAVKPLIKMCSEVIQPSSRKESKNKGFRQSVLLRFSMSEFDDIRPYNDSEVPAVIARLIASPEFIDLLLSRRAPLLSKICPWLLRPLLRRVLTKAAKKMHTVADLQSYLTISLKALVAKTTDGFSFSGLDKLDPQNPTCFLATTAISPWIPRWST